jgi:hypothetical protein
MFVFFKILDYDHAKGFARERGHGTKANPNSETLGNDYRHGLRRVYHNGTELFTTKREGRIPSRIINRFLKQKEKQGESYDGSNQRW